MEDINVQLKACNNNGEVAYNLFPRTNATNVVETEDKRFVTDVQIEKWDQASSNTISAISTEDIASLFD